MILETCSQLSPTGLRRQSSVRESTKRKETNLRGTRLPLIEYGVGKRSKPDIENLRPNPWSEQLSPKKQAELSIKLFKHMKERVEGQHARNG